MVANCYLKSTQIGCECQLGSGELGIEPAGTHAPPWAPPVPAQRNGERLPCCAMLI